MHADNENEPVWHLYNFVDDGFFLVALRIAKHALRATCQAVCIECTGQDWKRAHSHPLNTCCAGNAETLHPQPKRVMASCSGSSSCSSPSMILSAKHRKTLHSVLALKLLLMH